jgi:16S rRNA (cytosine967-C5)-methyltransferase
MALPFVPASFDAVLLDAPCTGLGTMGRRPDIRWRRTPADMAALARRQAVMLRQAAEMVRPGGRLVYAVCTFTRAEGPELVSSFLAERPDFAMARPPAGFPHALVAPDGTMRTWPHVHGTDAFYAAVLSRAHDRANA